MGVPVVTCVGATMGSRQAASVLTAIGLDRWIANDPNHMVQRTLGLIDYKPNLHANRHVMRERLERSPLLNGQRLARQIEAMVNTEMKAFRQ
jgi:protein O-GlcNAc transferase